MIAMLALGHLRYVGQQVLARNYRAGPRWICGQIAEKRGAVSYRVKVGGEIWKRHADQLWAYRGQQGNSNDSELPGQQESGGRGTELETTAAPTTPGH